jgi:hypothetical protein
MEQNVKKVKKGEEMNDKNKSDIDKHDEPKDISMSDLLRNMLLFVFEFIEDDNIWASLGCKNTIKRSFLSRIFAGKETRIKEEFVLQELFCLGTGALIRALYQVWEFWSAESMVSFMINDTFESNIKNLKFIFNYDYDDFAQRSMDYFHSTDEGQVGVGKSKGELVFMNHYEKRFGIAVRKNEDYNVFSFLSYKVVLDMYSLSIDYVLLSVAPKIENIKYDIDPFGLNNGEIIKKIQ